jgi:HlyD family secretion protein
MTLARVGIAVMILALLSGAAVWGLPTLSHREERIPTTRPTRGDLDVRVHTLGELSPRRSMALSAPSVGGALQIVRLAAPGLKVREGDVVIAFDQAEQLYNLQQAESELAEAEQELVKLQADGKVQRAQDRLTLLHAQHEVRRAEIEVSGNEFVGAIQAEKNKLALEEARRNLTQIEADVTTHAESNRAALAVVHEKRSKAKIAADFARKNIDSMTVRAPLGGLVVVKDNQDASGGFMFPGMSLPEYRVGDTVQPGRTIAEIVDLSDMEIRTKIAETDRGAVGSGVPAKVHVEGLPSESLTGSSRGVGGLAQKAFWEPATSRQFSAVFGLSRPSQILRPGMTARLVIEGERLTNVMHVPRQVLFESDGKSVVYVRDGAGFKPVPVKVLRVTENRAVLQGLSPDVEVALVNPTTSDRRADATPASTMPGGSR